MEKCESFQKLVFQVLHKRKLTIFFVKCRIISTDFLFVQAIMTVNAYLIRERRASKQSKSCPLTLRNR